MKTPVPRRPEAQARRLLAAYPWRMRAEQGDEIVATVLDTLPPGAARLPWRTVVDLVRGGLRTRRQRRPPFLTWLAYHSGRTIHPRWIWWVFDRLEDPRYRRNDALHRILGAVVALGALAALSGDGFYVFTLLWMVPAACLGARFHGEGHRNRVRARYGLVAGGSNPNVVWVTTARRAPRPVARWMVGRIPGARVWTPALEQHDGIEERPADPAS